VISKALLEKRGLTHEKLKALLAPGPKDSPLDGKIEEKLKDLRNRIRTRIQAGRDNNLLNHQVYFALDKAWDLSQRQIEPTLLEGLLRQDQNTKFDEDAVLKTLRDWNFDMDRLVIEEPDRKTPGKTIKKVNLPAFFNIYVPLMKAYVTIRWAKT
jgi:hypothetical protein